MRTIIRRTATAAALTALLGTGVALPAMADVPVPVTAHVNSSVGFSAFTPGTIAFPATDAGQTATAPAITYTASSNSAGGFNVVIAAVSGNDLARTGGGATIPEVNMGVRDNGAAKVMLQSNSTTTVYTQSTPGSTSNSDVWSLNIPAGQASGDYTGIVTYQIAGM